MIKAPAVQATAFRAFAAVLVARVTSGTLEPVMRTMKRIGERAIAANFAGSRRSTGEAWAARKRTYAHPILIKTGHMLRSATTETEPGHVETVGPRDAMSGTNVFYSIVHQRGTRKMVARPFEELPDSAVDDMETALVDYFQTNVFGR